MRQILNGVHILNKDIFFANFRTPVVKAMLISSTSPFGSMPNRAATEATTAV